MASESIQPAVEPRTLRAVSEYLTVIEEAPALFQVVSESGSSYLVDLREPACNCPDFQHRDEVTACKHIIRTRLAVGQIDTTALERRLTERADQLEANATDLEQQASELAETAHELRKARSRLEEVVE